MNFKEIAERRQSCRSFDPERKVPEEAIRAIISSARLAPSACNGQPYHITVCQGDAAREVARATQRMGMNKFASDAPVMIVISEKPYVASAAVGARLLKNDYRSIDIGILSAYITAEAEAQGLGSCILGWLESEDIKKICSLDGAVRLVIAIGYASEGYALREKKRKAECALVSFIGK
jgi:nitroreductase